jgi:hypothetical protein
MLLFTWSCRITSKKNCMRYFALLQHNSWPDCKISSLMTELRDDREVILSVLESWEIILMQPMKFLTILQGINLQGIWKYIHVRLLGTRFTNAISCLEPGPQEPYRDFFTPVHFTSLFSSLQMAAHRKPFLTLLHMHDILARMMWRRPTLTLTSLQCGTMSRRHNVGSGGMRRSILATSFHSADTFY